MHRIIRLSLVVLFAATSTLWSADEGGPAGEARYPEADFQTEPASVQTLLQLALNNVPVDEGKTLEGTLEGAGVPVDLRDSLKTEAHRTIPTLVKADPEIRKTIFAVLEKVLQTSPVDTETRSAIEAWLDRVLTYGGHSTNASQTELLTKMLGNALYRDAPTSRIKVPLEISAGVGTETRSRVVNFKPLHEAAMNGQIASAAAILAASANLNPENRNGNPSLHVTATNCGSIAVHLLLAAGADPNALNSWEHSRLLSATLGLLHAKTEHSYSRCVENVMVLLAAGANPNKEHRIGDTFLTIVARHGLREIVNPLLAAGANPNAYDSKGDSPLYVAIHEGNPARKGYAAIIQALLAAGANPNAHVDEQDPKQTYFSCHEARTRLTPLIAAIRTRNTASIELLLAAGADPNAKNYCGDTPLHQAVALGCTEKVKTLLAARADPNARDNDGRTPLALAAKRGHTELVEALLAAGADINAGDNDGHTPLALAIEGRREAAARALLAAGADPNAKNRYGYTLLAWAAESGRTEIVKILRAHGAR